jgi:UDP-glucose:(heptosyl)LPS alpha-1,3-glucosyltransferase
VHLVVCGGGSLKPYRKWVERNGLSGTVHLVGFLDDVRHGFHGADFFVQPTWYDPCSLVVFEALACGLPVVTTRNNGAGEVMTPGREGFVLSRPDAEGELLQAFDVLADDQCRAEMAEAARALGRAQTMDRHVAALLAVCEEVAAARRPVTSGVPAPHVGRSPRSSDSWMVVPRSGDHAA